MDTSRCWVMGAVAQCLKGLAWESVHLQTTGCRFKPPLHVCGVEGPCLVTITGVQCKRPCPPRGDPGTANQNESRVFVFSLQYYIISYFHKKCTTPRTQATLNSFYIATTLHCMYEVITVCGSIRGPGPLAIQKELFYFSSLLPSYFYKKVHNTPDICPICRQTHRQDSNPQPYRKGETFQYYAS